MSEVLVIGGGAAGMMAAAAAAEKGHSVTLLEKNEKLGKKVYITGKGRCNVTNNCGEETFFESVLRNPRFLYSAYAAWNCHDMMAFLEENGVRLKTERGNRVFPVSDHASDITKALEKALRDRKVRIRLHTEVTELVLEEDPCDPGKKRVRGVNAGGEFHPADLVIVATGGLSYASTGSTGDGYRFAGSCGHTVTPCSPSLVPMEVKEADAPLMQGLSLRNVEMTVRRGKKIFYRGFGEMLFTHFGLTGPLVLTASALIPAEKAEGLICEINLKPAMDEETVRARLQRAFDEAPNRQVCHALEKAFPAKLVPVLLSRAGIAPEKPARDITKGERAALTEQTRALSFTVKGLRGFSEAVITRGGVSVREVDPRTMRSKKVNGLSFAGEVLDIDAVTGGFNLQIAWTTGHAAGYGAE